MKVWNSLIADIEQEVILPPIEKLARFNETHPRLKEFPCSAWILH